MVQPRQVEVEAAVQWWRKQNSTSTLDVHHEIAHPNSSISALEQDVSPCISTTRSCCTSKQVPKERRACGQSAGTIHA